MQVLDWNLKKPWTGTSSETAQSYLHLGHPQPLLSKGMVGRPMTSASHLAVMGLLASVASSLPAFPNFLLITAGIQRGTVPFTPINGDLFHQGFGDTSPTVAGGADPLTTGACLGPQSCSDSHSFNYCSVLGRAIHVINSTRVIHCAGDTIQ